MAYVLAEYLQMPTYNISTNAQNIKYNHNTHVCTYRLHTYVRRRQINQQNEQSTTQNNAIHFN
jgi:hypothetical protein